jgi:PAS domain S-box-containing protein
LARSRSKGRMRSCAAAVCLLQFASVLSAPDPRPAKIAIAEGRNTRFAHLTTKVGFLGDREGGADSRARHLQNIHAQGGYARVTDLRFTHLTTNDGLSQSYVNAILQDRRGFMWFGTRDGLNRYDGNDFVVYKHNASDPGSLSANFVEDLREDDHGYLWIATHTGGVDKFDPTTERFAHYRHDPSNPNSIGSDWVERIARDSRGYLWFGTGDSGLDKFNPATGIFTHYLKDSDGRFVGEITDVIADSHGDIWFVGERGLFHLNPQTGQITRPPASIGLAADYVYEDSAGNLWMLAYSPIVGLIKYDRQAERLTKYPVGAGAVGVAGSNLLADGKTGLWVPSSQGLYYFDRRTEGFTYRFQHDESNPDTLNDNTVVSVYQDRGGLLWVGTEDGGLNLLNLRQEQFGAYRHRPADPTSLSPGEVTAIYEEPNGILWVGFYPRALDRLDRKTGQVTHYVPRPENRNALGKGRDVNGIYQDARGYLWLSGWEGGLDRFDERTGQFKHYRHNPDDPNSLITNYVFRIYGDRSGQLWVGQNDGVSRLDPLTEQFTNYRPDPKKPTSHGNWALAIYQDRSGTLWFGRGGGVLNRFDDKTKTFVNYTADSRDPHRLGGGTILAIHEDRAGTLWLGASDGLYQLNRQNGTFTRYTESQGLPSSTIACILEDKVGRLWIGTNKGISLFDPQTERFRNYDVSDGLQSNEFGKGCYQGPEGEMFFGGSNGFNAFFPEAIQDYPYVPPVVITRFKVFNKPVPIGARSVLTKAISYVDGLTLSYRDNVLSLEFAALSYANFQKNRYRYKLEPLESGWNEVDSKHPLATYTNLDPGKYVFRVQGSTSDGIWNEEGVWLPIFITPPWWKTNWFRALCAVVFLALLWVAYRLRGGQLKAQEERFREAVETMPALAFIARPDGYRTFVNRGWAEYTGLSVEQASGFGWRAAVHPDDLQMVIKRWQTSAGTGEPLEYETRLRRGADGGYRWFQTRAAPVRDKHGKMVKWCGVAIDIDDRKRAEEERERLRQMEADLAHINRVSMMGELSASIAHEVNQPLSGVVSNASACLRWLTEEAPNLEEARGTARRIVRDGKRAAEVIARMRALTKRAAATLREQLDLNETIRDVLALIRDEANIRNVIIRTQFADDLSPVSGDRVQLQQVLLNLVMNATEAMSNVSDRARELVLTTRNLDANQVQVTVEDSGTGLDPNTIDKIFDPFYTTKPEGMGMGLSISRSIVQAHGGRLWATVKDGTGTIFSFTLRTYHEEGANAGVPAV